MSAVRVIHLTPFEAQPDGHGGNRRSYQIRQDLLAALPAGEVAAVERPLDFVPKAELSGLRRQWRLVVRLLRTLKGNPLKPLRPTPFTPFLFSAPSLLAHYEALVKGARGPVVCVAEHPGFGALAPINARYGVRTVGCPQNLESLDTYLVPHADGIGLRAKALDLATELEVLAGWDERLLISRVEAGLLAGFGMGSLFYPYRPVAETRARLERVRAARSTRAPARGLFLMLGTAGHETTRRSLEWCLACIREQGLPAGARVVVGGLHTDELAAAGPIPGVELRGWIESDELETLLARATGFLVPQTLGFGGITRVADLACAGVPVMASEQALWAVGTPPGVHPVANAWSDWRARMERLMEDDGSREGDYEAWAAAQPRPLVAAVKRLLDAP